MKNLNDEEFYALGEMLFSNRCMQKEKQDKILEYSKEDVESYLNYGKRMAQFAVSQPEKIAIVDEQERITYKQLRERCMVLAAYFQSEGINKGDKVALQMENSGMFIIITLALFEIGAIPIMLLPAHQKREIEGVVKKAEPKVIITDRGSNEYQKMIQGIIDDSISVQKWYITEQLRNIQLENSMKLEAAEEIRQDDLVMLLLSGGTTGIPKLIPRTQGDYIYNNEALARGLQLNQDDIFLAVLPLAHNFPLGAPGIMGTLLVGGTVVVSKYPTPLEIFSLIEEEKVTYVSMVPTILNMCLQYRSFDDSDDLSSLKFIMVGGAVLPTELSRKVDDLFSCKLIQIYGTAEGLCCVNSLKDSWETRCTVQGKPCSPFDELKIIDEKGNEVAEGELVTKGPYTIKEYYRLEDKENQYFTEDGYYRTGDKVRIDEQGNVVVLGRAKEQINRAGEKIMPSEVEENLLMHDAIKECAVVGIKDETLGNRICAFVVTENQEITLSEARSFLTEKGMASFKLPDQLEIIAAMPYTAVKKIDKKKLAAMLEEN